MSFLNLLVHLNIYEDQNASNNPSKNNVKWTLDQQGLSVMEPESRSLKLGAGQSYTLFSGNISISADGTTLYNIALKAGTSSTYRVSHSGGTAPLFRTPRTEGHDATTEVTVTKNAKLLTFTSTGGTLFSLIAGGAVVGDEVRIGNAFNVANRGKFKILSLSATSFIVENEAGTAEGAIVLGASFATEINIFSADGVQINDKVDIIDGFSPVTQDTYDITDVSHDYIEIHSANSLPTESSISNSPEALVIYRDAKQFLYIESNKKLSISLNGSTTNELEPFICGTEQKPGVFMSKASIKSATIENKSTELAEIFFITAE